MEVFRNPPAQAPGSIFWSLGKAHPTSTNNSRDNTVPDAFPPSLVWDHVPTKVHSYPDPWLEPKLKSHKVKMAKFEGLQDLQKCYKGKLMISRYFEVAKSPDCLLLLLRLCLRLQSLDWRRFVRTSANTSIY